MIPAKQVAIVIPTYNRSQLLGLLIKDLFQQTMQPGLLVIVDGNPKSDSVISLLSTINFPVNWKVVYIPSNHSNAPYQRYLGLKVASDYDVLIYIDDDIRIFQTDAIENTVLPFYWEDSTIVGLSPVIEFPKKSSKRFYSFTDNDVIKYLSTKFGYSRKYMPGEITPIGDRILPIDTGDQYAVVSWLRGGFMAYRSKHLKEAYTDDIFALSHIRCGLGADDTVLSHRVGKNGNLLYAFSVKVNHPDADQSRAYPSQAYSYAYAKAYSRRFIHDAIASKGSAYHNNRNLLLRSYCINILFNWIIAMLSPRKNRFSYAIGYTLGAIHGVMRKPTTRNLTPEIDWYHDAEQAINSSIVVSKNGIKL